MSAASSVTVSCMSAETGRVEEEITLYNQTGHMTATVALVTE